MRHPTLPGMACVVCNTEPGTCQPNPWGLSRRELEVVGLVCAGHANDAIAQCLAMSVRTVQSHVGQALRKSGTTNRTHLAVCALRRRVVPFGACPCKASG